MTPPQLLSAGWPRSKTVLRRELLLDGKKQMIATTPYCPEIAAKQHFYLIVNSNFHYKKDLDYLMFVSSVRAFVPPTSPLPAAAEAKEIRSKP